MNRNKKNKITNQDKYSFDELDRLIQKGSIEKVQKVLDDLMISDISREEVSKLAQIARRVGYHRFALRVLAPVIRPQKPIAKAATNSEIIEYAAALMKAGIVYEAIKLLSRINPKNTPDVDLYLGFSYMTDWNYENANECFARYLQSGKLNEYQKNLVLLNRGACYIHLLNYDKAAVCLKAVKQESATQDFNLLYANALEIEIEMYIFSGRLNEAKKNLEESDRKISQTHYRYKLFSLMWHSVVDYIENPNPKNFKKIDEVQEKAKKHHAWEIVREIDLLKVVLTKDSNLLNHLYFGTPNPFFRKKLLKLYKGSKTIENYFDRKWFDEDHNCQRIFDLNRGFELGTEIKIQPGKVVHQLLQILASDFYKSFKIEELFSRLFPNEFYNYLSSDNRVHAVLVRLRKWLTNNNIPIKIEEINNEYKITATSSYAIRINNVNETPIKKEKVLLTQITERCRGEWFTITELLEFTDESRSTLKRMLSLLLKEQLIESSGASRNTKYRIVNPKVE